MLDIHPKYIIDENLVKREVILNIDEWNNLLNMLDELEDIQAYDEAKNIKDEIIPFEQALKEIKDVVKIGHRRDIYNK